MSDAMASMESISGELGGVGYSLAPRDIECELLFASAHKAWAASDLEAIRGRVGEKAYQARLDRQEEMRASNRFAFASTLSLQFLATPDGMAEYVLLLAQRGHEGGGLKSLCLTRRQCQAAARASSRKAMAMPQPAAEASLASEWDRLVEEVLRRDFPFLLAREGVSPDGETP